MTASLSIANAAVVPGAPHRPTPKLSIISATLSPTAGVGASDKSTIPKGTPNFVDAVLPTNSPILVILKAVFLITSAILPRSRSGYFLTAFKTTPGPLTPTLITVSGSPIPWNAPAINGLSSGTLQKTTNFAHPNPPLSAVYSAVFLTISPINLTASIFIPALVEPILTEEQTLSVTLKAVGILSINIFSELVKPLCTKAEKPPIKFTPTSLAALSIAWATLT